MTVQFHICSVLAIVHMTIGLGLLSAGKSKTGIAFTGYALVWFILALVGA